MGDAAGLWRTRTIQRKPLEQRKGPDNSQMVVGVPWKKNNEDENVGGEMLTMDVKVMDKEYRDQLEAAASEREAVPRRVAI